MSIVSMVCPISNRLNSNNQNIYSSHFKLKKVGDKFETLMRKSEKNFVYR
jgi:hypothetical protein